MRAVHPEVVRGVFEQVLESEWLAQGDYQRILGFAPRASKGLSLVVRSVLLGLLETHRPSNPKTVRCAADVLLVSNDETPRVVALVRSLVDDPALTGVDVRCGWLRVWVHLDPIAAADWLESRRREAPEVAGPLIVGVARLLDQDVDHHGRSSRTVPMGPRALERWVRLFHGVPSLPEHEARRLGAGVWRGCLNRLAEDVSMEAHQALRRLREDPDLQGARELLEGADDAQLIRATAAAATPWAESDVLEVEHGDERRPAAPQDLFALVRRHLSLVGSLVQGADFSYRALFNPDTPEKEIQRWVASSLKLVSRGLYSVIRENEVDDDKKVDISAFADGLARVPIEIKPLGPYSLSELTACIEDQLFGKYMRPSDVRYGILLLVRQQEKGWKIAGKLEPFSSLVKAVRSFATDFGTKQDKIISVEVIDLVAQP